MERGLLWLPLLAIFIWLAYAGWNEYQRIEAYKTWAVGFDRAKFDLYAVLGQTGKVLTWGKPARQGPIDLQECSLEDVERIDLSVDGTIVDLEAPPRGRQINLALIFKGDRPPAQIPFTEVDLAARWGKVLSQMLRA